MSVVEVAFASAVVTGDFNDLKAQFHVGDVVIALSVTLMVVGFGLGPLFWSPVVRRSLYYPPTWNILIQTFVLERDSWTKNRLDYSRNHLRHIHHPLCRCEEHSDSPYLSFLLWLFCIITFDPRGWHYL